MIEPLTVLYASAYFVGAQIVRKPTDELADLVWTRLKRAFTKLLGREPVAADVTEATIMRAATEEPSIKADLEAVLGRTSGLRRAQLVHQVFDGATILWVDDRPENNVWERRLFQSLGSNIVTVETTRSARECLRRESFDVVISDVARDNNPKAGLDGLPELLKAVSDLSVIFYVGQLSSAAPPERARGITDEPNELLHLVLDQLERRRL